MRGYAAALVCTILSASSAGSALAQSAKWDQVKVSALSSELVQAVTNLQNSLENSAQAMNPETQETVFQVADALGLIEFEAARLNMQIRKGKGMRETLPTFKRLQQLHREAQEDVAGQLQVSAFLAPSLAKAKAALTQLAAYYPPQPGVSQ